MVVDLTHKVHPARISPLLLEIRLLVLHSVDVISPSCAFFLGIFPSVSEDERYLIRRQRLE